MKGEKDLKELLLNQLPKLAYGLFFIFAIALCFCLMIGTAFLIMFTHGLIQVAVISIVILLFALIIGNEYY